MKRSTGFTISMCIVGLSCCTGLEAWRPGMISAAVDLSSIWIASVLLSSAALIIGNKKQSVPRRSR